MAVTSIDPYITLGVSPDSSADEIKAAYRRVARRLHPDANPNNPGAAVQFQDVTVAYELLIDADRRRAYDHQIARQRPDEGLNFSLRVTPSKRAVVPLPEPQVIYLLAEILPDPRARNQDQKRETRLNLTLVLDHSNSMNGTRLDKVKVAAHEIVNQLSEGDILSVVSFNDRAEVIIPATPVQNKQALKAKISMMIASGGTEIFKGLSAGVEQNRRFLGPKLVNHVVLLTDGNTFGDHENCIELARKSAEQGISISAMGLGQEWNDEFLDQLASVTGGTSSYINSASAVVSFLNNHVRNLSNAFAERVRLSVAPDPDVKLESAFKLSPHPQPLTVDDGYIQLGSLQANRNISVLLQFQLPANMALGFRSVARLVSTGDVLANQNQHFQSLSDISLEVNDNPPPEDPPVAILDALGKLTLYRMQERAQEALASGDIREATRRLENLATRLLAMGEEDLANQARSEARRVAHTSNLSDAGRKTLKYQTRFLLLGPSNEDVS
ncbi:MAG: VWA domain-containing protein [Chloroflexi bacterium]|nr:VWA domain-containing protein [Chloroflexota bacterium]MDL1883973.1 VWA domain-containing protein [Anaerolineae bacterium CFX8]